MKRELLYILLTIIMAAGSGLPRGAFAGQTALSGVSAAPVDGDAVKGETPGAVGGPDSVRDEAVQEGESVNDEGITEEEAPKDDAIEEDEEGRESIETETDTEKRETEEKYSPVDDDKAVIQEKEKKKGIPVLSDREHFGIFAGYGGYVPLGDYGARYRPAHMASVTASVLYLDIFGISPELHFRYAYMASRKDPSRYSSSLTQAQFFPGLIYRYEFRLPEPMTGILLFGRIWDGVSQVTYRSVDPNIPVMKRKVVEYINTFGLSAGVYVDLWKGIMAGVELGYSMTATGGSPIHAFTAGLSVGYRI